MDSMTYQLSMKQEAMARFGLTFAEVDLPYAEWALIRAKLIGLKDDEHRAKALPSCGCCVCRGS